MGSSPAHLTGWAAYHPEGRLTNDDLVDRVDTTHDWLDAHVGISERRVVEPGETVASMGAAALLGAVKSAGLSIDDIDLIIGATSFDDHDMPAAAARIAELAGSQAFTFDVRAACSGWLVGAEIARSLLATGQATNVAIVASEHTGLAVDPDDRATVIFFGDAAGAGIISATATGPSAEVIDTVWHADNDKHAAVRIPRDRSFEMDARVTRPWVEAAMVAASRELLERNGLTSADVRGLICHQANLRLIERFAAAIGVSPDRHWHNVEWAGNTSAAGLPSSLAEGLDRAADDLETGDVLLAVTVGAGLNVVATLLRWSRG